MKYTKKFRNKNNKSKKKQAKTGGKVLGLGAYGWVIGDPAYPCNDEQSKNLDFLYSHVSKFANSDDSKESIIKEVEVSLLLKSIENIEDYIILVKDGCRMNPKYQFDEKNLYNNRWRMYDKKILDINNKTMALYKKGINDLEIELKKNVDFRSFQKNNNKLLNIAKGIQILQQNNLIHNDIKPVNCIVHDNTFKLIDITDIRDITTTNDMKLMPFNFAYFTWPSIALYTSLYMEDEPLTEITSDSLRKLYMKGNHNRYNDNQYIEYMKLHLYKPFFGFTMDGAISEKINIYVKKLVYQKTFGTFNNVNDSNYQQLIKKFIDFVYNKHPEQEIVNIEVENFLYQQKKIIDKIGKEGLLKRIDIYSFGIIILSSIYGLNQNMKNRENMNISTTIFQYYLYGLYRLVFYCCYQTENNPDINYIVDYFDTLNKLYECTTLMNPNTKSDKIDFIEKCANALYLFPDINSVSYTNFIALKESLRINNLSKKKIIKNRSIGVTRSRSRSDSRNRSRSRSRSRSRERENTDPNKMFITP
jgi:hypothetical protein